MNGTRSAVDRRTAAQHPRPQAWELPLVVARRGSSHGAFDGMNVADSGIDMRGCRYAEAPCGLGCCAAVRLPTAFLVPFMIADSHFRDKSAMATVLDAVPRGKLYSCCPLQHAQLTVVQRCRWSLAVTWSRPSSSCPETHCAVAAIPS